MKIMTIVRKAALPVAVAGAVILGAGCSADNKNQTYIKDSGISAKAYDSLVARTYCISGCGKDSCTNQFWQKVADSIKYQKIIDSVKQATIDSMNATKGIVEKMR